MEHVESSVDRLRSHAIISGGSSTVKIWLIEP